MTDVTAVSIVWLAVTLAAVFLTWLMGRGNR